MITSVVLIVLVIASTVAWSLFFGGRVPQPYFGRSCEGAGWRRTFPDASNEEIRAFLQLFVNAFSFRATEKLKLNPHDSIMGIYKALYPSQWTPDALEMETLARDLRRTYGLRLADVWRDGFTLGELFESCVVNKRIASA